MFASVLSASIFGLEVCPVQVEADISDGLPSFSMVGFPTAQVREAQDRVRTALRNHQIRLPPKRVTVNLAPADIRKEGSGFDLPVAAAILAAAGVLPPDSLAGVFMMGELSLNGELLPVSGVLPGVLKARELSCRFCVIPMGNAEEADLVPDILKFGVSSLSQVIEILKNPQEAASAFSVCRKKRTKREETTVDFLDVQGQESARRAVEIAVSGFHNLLMLGPPGGGKTMLAKRIPTIMPGLSYEEKLELTRIYSIAGLLSPEHPLRETRPFRSPHHTCSPQALAGGGRNPRPGEITLAHRGVLFLDEMPEFSRRSLEVLRQPLEDRRILLSRVRGTCVFPANFMLVAAMNPCPCGHFPDMERCRCTPSEVSHYLGKISQPLLERLDICVEVSSVSFSDMKKYRGGESSAQIQKRVERVQAVQKERYRKEAFSFNGEMGAGSIGKYCVLTPEGERLLERAYETMELSPRSCHRILKVPSTIAAMAGQARISAAHVGEALTYRALDKKFRSGV